MATPSDVKALEGLDGYKYGFSDKDVSLFQTPRGLRRDVVEKISSLKGEPEWMLEFRLKALEHFVQRPDADSGAATSRGLNLDEIIYYVRPSEASEKSWDDVPDTIKSTFEKLGIPEAERKFLAGVGAQYESEMVYHNIQKHLEDQGVIFLSIEDGLRQHPDLFRQYFGTVIPLHRQQVRRAQRRGLVGRLVHLRPQGRQDRPAAAGLLPPQPGQHRPVRAHADHRR